LGVLKAAFCNISISSSEVTETVFQLLDPSRFQGLELSFIDAATYIYDHLQSKLAPAKAASTSLSTSSIGSQYQGFAAFQVARTQLLSIIEKTQPIISEFVEKSFISPKALEDLATLSTELQSSEFRVAIIGEFSKGKSTLLNALLGEAIQPVRAIPCSGAISMIRYSDSPEIICYYEDGREEPLSQDQYQERVSIPRSEARGDNLSNALLAASQIEKVVFGSPKLELCRQGVVIIDSPGLNEHPKRTEVTQKILNKIDAAIFLSHAQNLLSQSEFQIVEDLRKRLNIGDESKPAQALFFVVNFIDLLEDSEDQEDIRKRANKKLLNISDDAQPSDSENIQVPILASVNRLHYLSAGKALKAIERGSSDEYLQSFNTFVKTLENFLVKESGSIRLAATQARLQDFFQVTLQELESARESLNGQIFSIQERKAVLEELGIIGGRVVLFSEQVDRQCNTFVHQYRILVQDWKKGFKERLKNASSKWTDKHDSLWERDEKIKSYVKKLEDSFSKDWQKWLDKTLVADHLEPALNSLDQESQRIIQVVDEGLMRLGEQIQSSKPDMKFQLRDFDKSAISGEMGSWGMGGAATIAAGALLTGAVGAAILIPSIAIAPIVAAVIALLGGGGLLSSGFGILGQLDQGIRDAVVKEGIKSIEKEIPRLVQQLEDTIRQQFHDRISVMDEQASNRITIWNAKLERDQEIALESLTERQENLVDLEDRKAKLLALQEELNSFSYGVDR
jgi:GTPase SAR1 family protein